MGLLQAITAIGKATLSGGVEDDEIREMLKYASLIESPENAVVVRVYLKVDEMWGDMLHIGGVSRIDHVEMSAIGDDETIKRKMPYLPVNANADWRPMPMLKVSVKKNVLEGEKKRDLSFDDVLDKDGDVRKKLSIPVVKKGKEEISEKKYTDLLLPNLLKKFILSLERDGVITPGSAEVIYSGMKSAGIYDVILDILSNKEYKGKKIIVVLGLDEDGRFVYPGDVPSFRKYYLDKMPSVVKVKERDEICPICGEGRASHKLSDILKFATIDKLGFTPMFKGEDAASFYICEDCYIAMTGAVDYIRKKLVVRGFLPGIQIWIIPELLSVKVDLNAVLQKVERYIAEDGGIMKSSASRERRLWKNLASLGEPLVFHMLFVKQNQAKLEIRQIISDVPPSRMAKLGEIYRDVVRKVSLGDTQKVNVTIDDLLTDIKRFFIYDIDTTGSSDRSFLIDRAIGIYASLLESERLPSDLVKIQVVGAIGGIASSDKSPYMRDVIRRAIYLSEMGYRLEQMGGDIS